MYYMLVKHIVSGLKSASTMFILVATAFFRRDRLHCLCFAALMLLSMLLCSETHVCSVPVDSFILWTQLGRLKSSQRLTTSKFM